jgi:molybdopterin converting factor subunit 1
MSATVEVRVLLFAALAEKAGLRERRLTLASGSTPRDAWAALQRDVPALAASARPLVAVDRSWADADRPLADGAELAFLPPIAGG